MVPDETGEVNECGLGDHIKRLGLHLKCNGKPLMGNRRLCYQVYGFKKLLWLSRHYGSETMKDSMIRIQEKHDHCLK